MDPTLWLLSSLLFFSAIRSSEAAIASGSSPIRGVAPEDEKYYNSGDFIKCRDGSKKFRRDQLNDDFCDCADSTDEPGTSACPNGKFYCRNAGHVPVSIFSSRVNDGICDCCDGSDEYDGKVKCTNTCWEAGKAARNRLKKKIETYKEGLTLRKQDVEQARVALVKDEAELTKLQREEKILKGLVQQLKERKELIDKEEERERLQKEQEEKAKREAEEKEKKEAEEKANQEKAEVVEKSDNENNEAGEKSNQEKNEMEEFNQEESEAEEKAVQEEGKNMQNIDDKIGLLEDDPLEQGASENQDNFAVEVEHGDHSRKDESLDSSVNQGKDESENTEELSREELGRRIASRWTGENIEQQTEEAEDLKDADRVKDDDDEEQPDEAHDVEDEGYGSGTDDEHNYDEDNVDDHSQDIEDHDDHSSYKSDSENDLDSSETTISSNPTWLEKIQQTVRSILQAVNLFQTQVDKSDAARIRKEYDDSSSKLSKMQSRISSLTKKLKQDLGPDKEFYSFYGRCFESKQNKYVYKVCPFKEASQVEGHSTTQLGRWEKFEDTYKVMHFANGDKCWNGPDRSLKVKLRCGLKNEITDVDEPSRCEYVALLSTPSVCLEEKLMELQLKLDLMNKELPQVRDEL